MAPPAAPTVEIRWGTGEPVPGGTAASGPDAIRDKRYHQEHRPQGASCERNAAPDG